MNSNDRINLIRRISEIEGLTDKERSALLGLLRESKAYGLVWEDKPEAVEERLRDELPVLTEVKERALISEDKDAPNHILIEGDNFEALTTLAYTHAGRIDVIYIDPPYNTGNKDFVYNDSFVDKEDSYRHSKWLSFMSRRLKIAKQLLSDKGVIFISIDDNEQAQLKLLCDDVFGEENFRNIINTRRLDKNLSQQFIDKGLKSLAVGCEYVLVYSKSNNANFFPITRVASDKRKSQGYWKGFWNAADRPTMRYAILGYTPEEGQWKWKEEKAQDAVDNYETYLERKSKEPKLTLEEYWVRTGKKLKFIRRRVENSKGKNKGVEHWVEPTEGILRTSNWSDILTTETNLNMEIQFSSPKSISLIKEILKFGTLKGNSTFLDFFAGSGTTLHATMQLNAEDGGHRQCILVTNNENGICENVTYERNKRVIQGYTTPKGEHVEGLHKNNLRYYKTDFVPREPNNRNKRALVAAATDLLCIKNDVYKEQVTFGGHKLKQTAARYFDDGKTQMLIIYNELTVEAFVKAIDSMDVANRIKVYVFSNNRYAYNDNFEPVSEKVEVCALPAAIYDAYKKVLKPRKQSYETSVEVPFIEEPSAEIGQGTLDFKEEGGEA